MGEKDRLFTETHEWLSLEGDVATLGLTDYAQGELGDIVFVELPEPGTSLSAGDVLTTVESVKSVSEIYAPVAGEIVEGNAALDDDPVSHQHRSVRRRVDRQAQARGRGGPFRSHDRRASTRRTSRGRLAVRLQHRPRPRGHAPRDRRSPRWRTSSPAFRVSCARGWSSTCPARCPRPSSSGT